MKAHILLGSREENGIQDTGSELSVNELIMECVVLPEYAKRRASVFTVENMADLLIAYYASFNLTEAIGLYKKCGFRECEAYYDNPMRDVMYMKKAL